MLNSDDPTRSRRRLVAGLIGGVALLGVTVTVAVNRSSSPTLAPAPPAAPAVELDREQSQGAASSPLEVTTSLPAVRRSADGAAFARTVALDLFSWDTTHQVAVSDYAGRILAVTAAEESAGLASDLGNYLPPTAVWPTLREYRTRQWLEITSVTLPRLWAQAVAEAGPDGLLPGTAAYTIRGTRHRAGIWEDAPVTSAHPVSFTVFVVCSPTYPTCHLLRLSLPNEPLE